MKKCGHCGRTKPNIEFSKYSRIKGLQSWCKVCHSLYAKENPSRKDKVRAYHLKSKYDLTPEEFNEMFEAQEGKCAICKREREIVVDHNHSTNKVRELLCRSCNVGLGAFDEDELLFDAAKEYLARWQDD